MQSAAEKVHFIAGGQWAEEVVGTNALALSLKLNNPVACFPMNTIWVMHDWVCYAAPVIDPIPKQCWVWSIYQPLEKHNTFRVLAAERCASIIQTALD